jgi:hypothetical protein
VTPDPKDRKQRRSQPASKRPARGPREPESSWTIKPASARAHKEWTEAIAAEPEVMAATRKRLRTRPLDRSDNPRRTGRLHGELGGRRIGEQTLPQWQHEMTAAGRIWYCPDKESKTVWVTKVSLGHTKETE